jgi:FMN phosphatase YigB (HAD superfamily)
MSRPASVVFDLGNVLVSVDYSIAARKIAARATMSPAEVQRSLDHSPLLFRFETGRMTREEFFREACAATGFRGPLAEFCGYFSDIFTPIEPMIAAHARLRARGVPTFICSNTNELAVAHIARHFPFFARFDGYVYSYQVGAMKPAAKIYEAVERVTGQPGAAILFLDDRLENAQAGAARGWQVIHHQSPEKTLPELGRLGLL